MPRIAQCLTASPSLSPGFAYPPSTFWFWRFGGVGGLPGLQTGGGRVLFCFIDIAGLCPGKSSVSTNAMIFLALMLRPCVLQARVLV